MLVLGASLTLGYMVVQANLPEGLLIQIVFSLDHPYTNHIGSIAPDEMRVTLALIDHGSVAPCDERGNPR